MGAVTSRHEDGLHALREAAEQATRIEIALTDDYLAHVAQVEAMPQNQSGADKTGIWRSLRAYTESFKHVRPARRTP
jgi:hypothetical protein